jgi:hypothetical protein
MKIKLLLLLFIAFSAGAKAQKVIPLYDGPAPNSKNIAGLTDTALVFPMGKKLGHFISRVARPELTIYLPEKVNQQVLPL